MSVQEEPRKPWPRWGVEIGGRGRARFDCWSDVPKGWKLEEPLPGEKTARSKPLDKEE